MRFFLFFNLRVKTLLYPNSSLQILVLRHLFLRSPPFRSTVSQSPFSYRQARKTPPAPQRRHQQRKYTRLQRLDPQPLCRRPDNERKQRAPDLPNSRHRRHGTDVQFSRQQPGHHHDARRKDGAEEKPQERDGDDGYGDGREQTEDRFGGQGSEQVDRHGYPLAEAVGQRTERHPPERHAGPEARGAAAGGEGSGVSDA